jgi:general secretion pathway protein A
MYQSFFGLKHSPFKMAPDAKVLFKTAQHLESIAGLMYTILNRKGLAVLTGDAGTGKTTVLTRVLQALPEARVRSSMIFHPTLSADDFLELVLLDFGIPNLPASKAQRLICLQQFLLTVHEQGKLSALIVDEAHKLTPELLEEIRLLGNFDHGGEKLLQILLIGQSELDELLDRNDLRQLKQRIAVRLSIAPLSSPQVEQYLRYRWVQAGGGENLPFATHVIDEIARVTKGVPRSINALCDSVLLLAFAEGIHRVAANHVREAANDLQMLAKPQVPMSAVPVDREFSVKAAGRGNGAVHLTPLLETTEAVPEPIRIPDFCVPKPPLIARWVGKLKLARQRVTR